MSAFRCSYLPLYPLQVHHQLPKLMTYLGRAVFRYIPNGIHMQLGCQTTALPPLLVVADSSRFFWHTNSV
jgi:hypothetical protein